MFERMLDKSRTPSEEEMAEFCEGMAPCFTELNRRLKDDFGTQAKTVFPYGNKYGWGVGHYIKGRLVCNVFPESGAFTVMIRLNSRQCDSVYEKTGDRMRGYLDNKFPCSDGGWIHYRVSDAAHTEDIMTAIGEKCR